MVLILWKIDPTSSGEKAMYILVFILAKEDQPSKEQFG